MLQKKSNINSHPKNNSRGARQCRVCSNRHGLIRKYSLNICRQCFKENARDIGFSKQQLGIDFSKKKKKKSTKKKSEEQSTPTVAEDELDTINKQASDLFGALAQKKKKKSKAKVPSPSEVAKDVGDAEGEDIDELIEKLKTTKIVKKAKKTKKTPTQERAAAAEEEEEAKKKPDTLSYHTEAADRTEEQDKSVEEEGFTPETAMTALQKMKNSENFGEKSWMKSDRDYLYEELLDRIFTVIQKSNPDLVTGTKRKFRIKPPQIAREPKKTVFVNLKEICASIKRKQEHVISYILTELSTTGSIDGEDRLIIKGVFNAKNMEIVLKKYIAEYVGCRHCGSLDTLLNRDSNTRLFQLSCHICSATRTVSNIRQGFLANTTPRRRRK